MKPTAAIVLGAALCAIPPGWAQTFETSPSWMEPDLYGFGHDVATAGDLNGDGFDDVILGAPLFDLSASGSPGAVQIFLGAAEGLSNEFQWFWSGPYADASMGYEVAFAGDVNGDGYDEVIFNWAGETYGMYVQFGAPSGHGIWTFDSGAMPQNVPPSIDGAGDLNGDGYDDIVAGFPGSDGDRGRIQTFHGSPLGLPRIADREVVGEVGQELGCGVRIVGDVDADGYDDLLACDSGETVALYLGSPLGIETQPVWSHPQQGVACFDGLARIGAAGDLNGDGHADVVVGIDDVGDDQNEQGFHLFFGSLAGLADEPQQTFSGEGNFGGATAAVGDVNGDGYDDLVVGTSAFDEGRVELFLGSEIGLQAQPAWTNDPVAGSSHLGFSVAPAGDVNGDGLVDLLVGDPGAARALLFLGTQPLGAGPAGSIAGASLLVSRDGEGRAVLSWSSACQAEEEDYVIYRGTLGEFDSHLPVTCSSGGLTSWTVAGDDGDRYYLVVPRSLDSEGSYGTDGSGSARPPSETACFPQAVASCE